MGKLEVDGDPAFLTSSSSGTDDDDDGTYMGDGRSRDARASTGVMQGNERFDPALHLLCQHHLTTTAVRYTLYPLHPTLTSTLTFCNYHERQRVFLKEYTPTHYNYFSSLQSTHNHIIPSNDSELAAEGVVKWRTIKSTKEGRVVVRFGETPWNDLVQVQYSAPSQMSQSIFDSPSQMSQSNIWLTRSSCT